MISKIEVGATVARFPSIERLAQAVQVDPAELFTSSLPTGPMSQGVFGEISGRLASLPKSDLVWISTLLDAVLARGLEQPARSKRPVGRVVAKPTKPPAGAKKQNR